MRFTVAALLSAAALAAMTGLASAQGPGGGMLMRADANQDRVVTLEEARASRAARFAELDTNKDAFLSADEAAAGMPPGAPAGAGAMVMRLDANGDGKVSKDEYAAGVSFMFDRLDANKDGRIDQAEIDGARAARGGGG
jgi:hypothetical protein